MKREGPATGSPARLALQRAAEVAVDELERRRNRSSRRNPVAHIDYAYEIRSHVEDKESHRDGHQGLLLADAALHLTGG